MTRDDPRKDLLYDEQMAAFMAKRAEEALDGRDDAVFSATLDVFCVYLATDFEEHLLREEAVIFPLLEARGLVEEVAEARRQHRDLRRMRTHLAACACQESRGSARHVLGTLARLLAHHVRYEADFVYGAPLASAPLNRIRSGLQPSRAP